MIGALVDVFEAYASVMCVVMMAIVIVEFIYSLKGINHAGQDHNP